MKILLLEDDVILQDIIEEYLLEIGYEVESFYDGEKALDAIGVKNYDMLLLDVNVPNIDGFEILSYLRDIGNTTPAIYITSLASIDDLKKGFDLGADDYLRKPFDLEELKVRIERIVKVHRLEEEIEFDGLKFIPKAHQLIMEDKVIDMRQKEAQVLEYFVRNTGKIISCDEIIENVWEDESVPTHATIRTYIKNLRKMFTQKEYFDNIKGEGYRFNIV